MSLLKKLERHPVMATLYGTEQLPVFLRSEAEVAILANIPLRQLTGIIDRLVDADKLIIVNIDSCEGLSPDRAAIEFLEDLGAAGIVSTRVPTMQQAVQTKMVAIQKVFITDRSTLPRSVRAISQSRADFVQIMPAPMLAYLKAKYFKAVAHIIASGFVCEKKDVVNALARGAIGVSSSDSSLWNYVNS
ncbi:Glycerol uptake operon antiterminator [Bartonella apis]|uniref:glycerol-3-phosphate responsive antiterminator n=1 Tax=Bartonella apis TaxID=1686310 RepID=UPI003998C5D6